MAGLVRVIGTLPAALAFTAVVVLAVVVFGRDVSVSTLGLVGVVTLAGLAVYSFFLIRSADPAANGPLAGKEFHNDRVDPVVMQLQKLHRGFGETVEPKYLHVALEGLFNRDTYRVPTHKCTDQDWGARLHAALQTLHVLEPYERSVPHLLAAVKGYAVVMTSSLFDPPFQLNDARPFVYQSVDDFKSSLHDKLSVRRRDFPRDSIYPAMPRDTLEACEKARRDVSHACAELGWTVMRDHHAKEREADIRKA